MCNLWDSFEHPIIQKIGSVVLHVLTVDDVKFSLKDIQTWGCCVSVRFDRSLYPEEGHCAELAIVLLRSAFCSGIPFMTFYLVAGGLCDPVLFIGHLCEVSFEVKMYRTVLHSVLLCRKSPWQKYPSNIIQ